MMDRKDESTMQGVMRRATGRLLIQGYMTAIRGLEYTIAVELKGHDKHIIQAHHLAINALQRDVERARKRHFSLSERRAMDSGGIGSSY